jgi:hypothetical protein
MNDTEKRELARKMTTLYDSVMMIWLRLKSEKKISVEEENLMWATYAAWSKLMEELGMVGVVPVQELRGGGEWPTPLPPYDWECFNAMK